MFIALGVVVARHDDGVGARAMDAQSDPGTVDAHRATAKVAAGQEYDHHLLRERGGEPRAAGRSQGPRDRSTWHAEPIKVFDNLYWVGQTEYSAWAVNTSDGIILVDTIYGYSVEDAVVGGLKKLGLDPAKIKYAIVSHNHSDHSGGARYLQEHFGTRALLSAADWALLDRSPEPTPTRDIVVTGGQKVTLGDTTLTMYLTPGHTQGTISTLIPVSDNGSRTLSRSGAEPCSSGSAAALPTSHRRPRLVRVRELQYVGETLSRHRGEDRRRHHLGESRRLRWIETEAASGDEAQARRSESVSRRQRERQAILDRRG